MLIYQVELHIEHQYKASDRRTCIQTMNHNTNHHSNKALTSKDYLKTKFMFPTREIKLYTIAPLAVSYGQNEE